LNGVDTARRIRARSDIKPQPKIIMVTAYGREEVRKESENVDLSGFLLKPVSSSTLYDTVVSGVFCMHDSNEALKQKSPSLDQGVFQQLQGVRILLVEDHEINQQVATELLEQAQMIVTIANNGQDGVEAVREGTYDVVLMDIQMPVMDGYEATRLIRRERRFKKLPIIAMTANAMAGDREKCIEAGMNDHIGKPIHPPTLFEIIDHYVKTAGKAPEATDNNVNQNVEVEITVNKNRGSIRLPTTLYGIDIKSALANVNNNQQLLLKVLGTVCKRSREIPEQIQAELDKGDVEVAKRLAHTFKGVAGTIGATRLQQQAMGMELLLRESKTEQAAELIPSFSEELEKVILALDPLFSQSTPLPNEQKTTTGVADLQDFDYLKTIFTKLVPFIDEGDSEAMVLVEELKGLLTQSKVFGDVVTMESQIEEYEFEEARETYDRIVLELGIL